jgi:biofilm PGA synthesis lipoprotein PgaB
MQTRLVLFFIVSVFLTLSNNGYTKEMGPNEFLVLCYHNVPEQAHPNDAYAVSHITFVKQLEYLRTHGYHPVSIGDILKFKKGEKGLPPKPILLLFDDAYVSYYTFVAPLLKEFGYPSILPVVGSWIDNPPKGLSKSLMNWEQIKELQKSNLVEIVSHSYDLHKGIQYNPQGNVGPAASVRAYHTKEKRYETEEEYRERIRKDFMAQKALFKRQLGFLPSAMVWPYGKYNEIALNIAQEQGCPITFTLQEGLGHINQMRCINRVLVENPSMGGNLYIRDFIRQVETAGIHSKLIRAAQVDLDLIYNPDSYEKTDSNLGKLIDRLMDLKINTVFLQAFSDPEGTGNIESVYFHNRILPIKGDIFNHAAHQMSIRGITVYAWMPTLGVILPDQNLNRSLRVLEYDDNGDIRPGQSWYERLTPFSQEVKAAIITLYEDLAAHNQIHGILFQDDAYLTDREDFHPDALKSFKDIFGQDVNLSALKKDRGLAKRWARFKTESLIEFTKILMDTVRTYHPDAQFARNLYAPLVSEPEKESQFAQHYELFLKNYDYVVVMAYPLMEEVKYPSRWLKGLARVAKATPGGQEKTIFKIQTYDWNNRVWIGGQRILGWLQDIMSAGGKHLAYYPDNVWENQPPVEVMKLEMSTKGFPFTP